MISVPGWAWADSIPASFGITTNVFIVFTANAFAVLGLRSLYFVLAGAMQRFGYLPPDCGLSIPIARPEQAPAPRTEDRVKEPMP